MPTPEDVTKERTLFSLYRLSYKFPPNKFNQKIASAIFLLLAVYCYFLWDNPSTLLVLFRKLVEIGLAFSSSILGFLVAGFTIYITVTNIALFAEIARKPYEDGHEESLFKYSLSAFIVAFAHYVSYLFACIFSVLFLMQGGLLSTLLIKMHKIQCLLPYMAFIKKMGIAVLLACFGTWTAYLVLVLKSFIFNIYAVVTIAVRTHMEKESN